MSATEPPRATWWLDPEMRGGYRYLRCEVPARHLPGVLEEGAVFDAWRQQGEVAVFRSLVRSDAELDGMREAKRLGVRVALDIEDNHLAGREDVPEVLQVSGEGLASFNPLHPAVPSREDEDRALSKKERLHLEALKLADTLIVPTEATAAVYRTVHPQVFVVPTVIDPDEWPALEIPDDGVFRIGLFASPSHACDLELVAGPLRWASQQADVEVILLGVNPSDLTWREYRDAQRQSSAASGSGHDEWESLAIWWPKPARSRQAAWAFPFRQLPAVMDYGEYRRACMQLDVGLCPIIEDPWSRCRSDSKALEYAMCGVLPIVSDVAPYEAWKGSPVLFASSAAEFLAHVQWAESHRGEVRERAMAVREIVLRERAMPAAVKPWRAAIVAATRLNEERVAQRNG